jgi:hypothetical protein
MSIMRFISLVVRENYGGVSNTIVPIAKVTSSYANTTKQILCLIKGVSLLQC